MSAISAHFESQSNNIYTLYMVNLH